MIIVNFHIAKYDDDEVISTSYVNGTKQISNSGDIKSTLDYVLKILNENCVPQGN